MKHAMLKGLKYAMFFVFLSIAMLLGQVTQLLVSADDIESIALNEWVKEDPSNQEMADIYLRQCLNAPSTSPSETEQISIMSMEDCAKKYDVSPVFVLTKTASSKMNYAWPLSVLMSQ